MAGLTTKLALIQMCASQDVAANTEFVTRHIAKAHKNGADFIATPEMSNFLAGNHQTLFATARPEADDILVTAIKAQAQQLAVHILLGSVAVKVADDKIANRSLLIGPTGEVIARYDKIHLFDVTLSNGEHYHESRNYMAGEQAVIAHTPFAKFGLSICYDMRFPALYRALAKAGADIITVPSAFTRPTGRAHWHILLQARAIETGCYVIAPAQCGEHQSGRKTYGHSLIVNPWGEIIAEAIEECGIIYAAYDPSAITLARNKIPALEHDRTFQLINSVNTGHGG